MRTSPLHPLLTLLALTGAAAHAQDAPAPLERVDAPAEGVAEPQPKPEPEPQPQPQPDAARGVEGLVVELITAGPNELVYSLYGHVGLRVVDPRQPAQARDRLFNFGVTNFNRPNYVQDFLTGRVEFWGAPEPMSRAMKRWRRVQRTVKRYPLNLSPAAVARLVDRLELDVTPERRMFIYDTFRDNCSTRVRDYLDEYTGGAVYAALAAQPTGRSYRDDVRDAYAGRPFLLLGTELVPGVELDRERTLWEMGYRPETLADALREVMIPGEGGLVPLLGAPEVLHARVGPDPLAGSRDRGQIILWALAGMLLVGAWAVGRLGPRWRGLLLGAYLVPSVGLGVILLAVGLTTDWPDMQRNWLVLGFVPLDAGLLLTSALLLGWRRDGGAIARAWISARVVVTALLVVGTALTTWLPGPLPPRVLALAGLAFAYRCLGTRRG